MNTHTEPWVWTKARWLQRQEDHSASDGEPLPYRSICCLCMLPATVISPTKKRKWMALCEACGKRSFVHPRSMWALVGLSADVWQRPLDGMATLVESHRQHGLRELQRVGFVDRELKVRNRRGTTGGPTWSSKLIPHLAEHQACMWCGEPSSAVVRHNQLGQPQVSCSACQTIVHGVREPLLPTYVGWSLWMRQQLVTSPTGGAWRAYRRSGKARWVSWTGGELESPVEATQSETTTQRRTG